MNSEVSNPTKRLYSELSPTAESPKMSSIDLRTMMEETLEKFGLTTIKSDLVNIKECIEHTEKNSIEALETAKRVEKTTKKMEEEMEKLKLQLEEEKISRLRLECWKRSSNLKILGIEENGDPENNIQCEEKVQNVFIEKMKITDIELDRCYRMGPKPKTNPHTTYKVSRPVMIYFKSTKDRDIVWRNRSTLKGHKIFLKEDLPMEVEERQNLLRPVYREAKRLEIPAKLSGDILIVDSKRYTVENIHAVPNRLNPTKLATQEKDNIILFHGIYSPLSNFYQLEHPFYDGKCQYNCVEQFYCAEKARTFQDKVAEGKIMKSSNPLYMKNCKVQGFDKKTWEDKNVEVMKKGIDLKFRQNDKLKQMLLDTGTRKIGEASPTDRTWGTGFGVNHPKATKEEAWGDNLLGRFLMELRDNLS